MCLSLIHISGGLPLKNRINIVLTRNENYKVKDAIIVHSIEELMEELKKYPAEDVYCIGGDTIYKPVSYTHLIRFSNGAILVSPAIPDMAEEIKQHS